MAICAVQQVEAAPLAGVIYDLTLDSTVGSSPTVDWEITSEALYLTSGIYKGDYEYIYELPSTSPGIDSFSVYGVTPTGIVDVTGTGGFGGRSHATHVSWTTISGDDVSGAETLTFISPNAPTWGYASALDDNRRSYLNNGKDLGVVVPDAPVPEGGLTVSLLGGVLLGLGVCAGNSSAD